MNKDLNEWEYKYMYDLDFQKAQFDVGEQLRSIKYEDSGSKLLQGTKFAIIFFLMAIYLAQKIIIHCSQTLKDTVK